MLSVVVVVSANNNEVDCKRVVESVVDCRKVNDGSKDIFPIVDKSIDVVGSLVPSFLLTTSEGSCVIAKEGMDDGYDTSAVVSDPGRCTVVSLE